MVQEILVERPSEVNASVTRVHDGETGELVGYRVSFSLPGHSEEEAFIERRIFRARSVTLIPDDLAVAFEIRDPHGVAQGKHNAENARREREGKPSLEDEAASDTRESNEAPTPESEENATE